MSDEGVCNARDHVLIVEPTTHWVAARADLLDVLAREGWHEHADPQRDFGFPVEFDDGRQVLTSGTGNGTTVYANVERLAGAGSGHPYADEFAQRAAYYVLPHVVAVDRMVVLHPAGAENKTVDLNRFVKLRDAHRHIIDRIRAMLAAEGEDLSGIDECGDDARRCAVCPDCLGADRRMGNFLTAGDGEYVDALRATYAAVYHRLVRICPSIKPEVEARIPAVDDRPPRRAW